LHVIDVEIYWEICPLYNKSKRRTIMLYVWLNHEFMLVRDGYEKGHKGENKCLTAKDSLLLKLYS